MAHPIKGWDYEVEDLDKAAGLAVVYYHARSPHLLSAEPLKRLMPAIVALVVTCCTCCCSSYDSTITEFYHAYVKLFYNQVY